MYPPPDDTPHPYAPGCFYNAGENEYICNDGNYFIDTTDYWTGGAGSYGPPAGSGGGTPGYYIPGAPDPTGRLNPPTQGGGGQGSYGQSGGGYGTQGIPSTRAPGGPYGSNDGTANRSGGLGLDLFNLNLPGFQFPDWLPIAALVALGIILVSQTGKKRRR